MNNSRFSFIKKNDTLYSEIESSRPASGGKRREIMKETKNRAARDIVVVGFALFSMFFGAGNVIFPPYLGMESGPQWLAGFSAYFIADIGLALAAMFALLRVGSSEAVLQRVGCVPSEILMCAIILCVGPMVAIPRTSASTFEMAIAPNLPGVLSLIHI